MPSTTPRLALPYPVQGDTVDVPRDIEALAEKLDGIDGDPPIGAVMMWALAAPPTNWLLCDGAAVTAAHPKLQALMPNTPDLRARVPVGVGAGKALGATGGAETHALTIPELPSHTHPPGGGTLYMMTAAGSTNNAAAGPTTASPSALPATTGATGGNGAHNNMQPYRVLNFIIRAA